MGGRGETEHLGHLRESHGGGFQQITDLGDGEPVDPVAGALACQSPRHIGEILCGDVQLIGIVVQFAMMDISSVVEHIQEMGHHFYKLDGNRIFGQELRIGIEDIQHKNLNEMVEGLAFENIVIKTFPPFYFSYIIEDHLRFLCPDRYDGIFEDGRRAV